MDENLIFSKFCSRFAQAHVYIKIDKQKTEGRRKSRNFVCNKSVITKNFQSIFKLDLKKGLFSPFYGIKPLQIF